MLPWKPFWYSISAFLWQSKITLSSILLCVNNWKSISKPNTAGVSFWKKRISIRENENWKISVLFAQKRQSCKVVIHSILIRADPILSLRWSRSSCLRVLCCSCFSSFRASWKSFITLRPFCSSSRFLSIIGSLQITHLAWWTLFGEMFWWAAQRCFSRFFATRSLLVGCL